MKKLLMTAALVSSITLSGLAYAVENAPAGSDHGGFFSESLSKLPEAKATAFKATMKQSREQNKDLFAQEKKIHEDLRTLMTAKTFDKDAFIAKDKELQQLRDQMSENRSKAFADALSGLTQDERTSLADAMKERHDKAKAHWKGHKGAKSDASSDDSH